jgi:hypothetical protein
VFYNLLEKIGQLLYLYIYRCHFGTRAVQMEAPFEDPPMPLGFPPKPVLPLIPEPVVPVLRRYDLVAAGATGKLVYAEESDIYFFKLDMVRVWRTTRACIDGIDRAAPGDNLGNFIQRYNNAVAELERLAERIKIKEAHIEELWTHDLDHRLAERAVHAKRIDAFITREFKNKEAYKTPFMGLLLGVIAKSRKTGERNYVPNERKMCNMLLSVARCVKEYIDANLIPEANIKAVQKAADKKGRVMLFTESYTKKYDCPFVNDIMKHNLLTEGEQAYFRRKVDTAREERRQAMALERVRMRDFERARMRDLELQQQEDEDEGRNDAIAWLRGIVAVPEVRAFEYVRAFCNPSHAPTECPICYCGDYTNPCDAMCGECGQCKSSCAGIMHRDATGKVTYHAGFHRDCIDANHNRTTCPVCREAIMGVVVMIQDTTVPPGHVRVEGVETEAAICFP